MGKKVLTQKDSEVIKRMHDKNELRVKVKTASQIISKVGTENLTRAIRETRDKM